MSLDFKPQQPCFQITRRDPRDFVEVTLPFVLSSGPDQINGLRLSLRYLTLCAPLRPTVNPDDPKVTLKVPLNGFDLTMSMRVEAEASATVTRAEYLYRISEIDPKAQSTLARLVRHVLTGFSPTVADLQEGQDPPPRCLCLPPQRRDACFLGSPLRSAC